MLILALIIISGIIMSMSEKVLLTPSEATAKLLNQFESYPSPNTLTQLAEESGSLAEAACWITAHVATTFCSALDSRGQETEYLSKWHRSVKKECSVLYDALLAIDPTMSREDVNQGRSLQLLNGIRRGVHRAMVRNQKLPNYRYTDLSTSH